MKPQVGQIWKIKEHIRIARKISYNYLFLAKIERDKKHGDVVFFEALGPIQHFETRTNQSYLTWLTANCELVSG